MSNEQLKVNLLEPMTIRQLFYRLVSTGLITNCQAQYQSLIGALSKPRGVSTGA